MLSEKSKDKLRGYLPPEVEIPFNNISIVTKVHDGRITLTLNFKQDNDVVVYHTTENFLPGDSLNVKGEYNGIIKVTVNI